MDKIQKIKEEIERRINEYKNWIGYQTDSNYLELKELLQFIDSIPEEPVNEDLNDAARDYSLVIFRQNGVDMECVGPDSVSAFKAGAEWQKQQMKEVLQTEYEKGRFDMREEMMKDAVEAEVFVDYNINFGYGSLTANIDLDEQHLKEGDKVKIIIIKEEQQ